MKFQECSTRGCTRQAAFATKTRPAWCTPCIEDILHAGGLEAVEPFVGLNAYRLTRCLTCAVQAHYKLQYTVDNNEAGQATCRACFYKDWAAAARERYGLSVRELNPRERIVQRLDAGGWDLVCTLASITDDYEPVLGKCRWCKMIRAAPVSDFRTGCACSRKNRSRHPTAQPIGKMVLADSDNEALAWWDHETNDKTVLKTATLRARRIARWRCPSCDLRFEQRIAMMTERPGCPACTQREAEARRAEWERLSTTPVAEVPDLLSAWDDEADPHLVMVSRSFDLYRFRCPNGHRSRLSPHTYLSNGCPPCRAASTRSRPKMLSEFQPEIASQWHPTRNGRYAPSNVVWNSKRTIWWRADCCGYEWQDTPMHRDMYQRLRCPQCRSILGSLAWHDPGLAAEWSPSNPTTPWHIRPHGSLAFVPEWICATDPRHTWTMPLSSRANGAECPECRPTGKSRVELAHYAAAGEVLGAAQSGAMVRHPAFASRKSWTIDVLVTTSRGQVAIEYDGAYWHRADAKILVDVSKSRDLLAAGYHVVRLREDDLPTLAIAHPQYCELRVHARNPRPKEVMESIRTWLTDGPGRRPEEATGE